VTASVIIRFVASKLLAALLTIWATTVIVFLALYLVPGNPLSVLLRGRKATPEVVAALRDEYGLDQPVLERYWEWLSGLLRGDLGYSITHQTEVFNVIAARLPTTLWLVSYAALIILIFGLAAGSWAAISKSKRVDQSILFATAALSAIPAFVAALVLMLFFSGTLRWFPAFGAGSEDFASRIEHLTLPAVALALTYVGLIARLTRGALKAQVSSDHVKVARNRGLPSMYIYRHHVLRNALNPILAYAGVLLAGLLVTSQLVEFAFGLGGLGSLLVESVKNIDFAVVQAITLLIVLVFILVNTLVDLIAPIIDPQLRQAFSS
jgi:peptide/nickel transport system permease protein